MWRFRSASRSPSLGWRDLTEELMKLITEQGYFFTATAESEIVQNATAKTVVRSLDYDTEHKSTTQIDKEKIHVLPDGNIIRR